MKKNLYVKAMSLAVVAATSFAVLACDNDNLSGPDFNSGNGGNSSAIEQPSPQSSSLEVGESSSSVNKLSSSSVVASSSSVVLLEECRVRVLLKLARMAAGLQSVTASSLMSLFVAKKNTWKLADISRITMA